MEKLNINLLPQEDVRRVRELSKFNLVKNTSVFFLLALVFLSSTAVSLRILQSQNTKRIQVQAKEVEDKVTTLQPKEEALVVLKNRLDAIKNIKNTSSKQYRVYKIVAAILPEGVAINSLSVDKGANVVLSVLFQNMAILDSVIEQLISGEGLKSIKKVELESLSRGRDGIFRANLKITAR